MKRKTILIKILLIFFTINLNTAFASIKNNVIVNVGNQIITSFELKNKINTILFLSSQEVNQRNIDKNKNMAIQSLINYKIKKQEILKYNISENNKAINDHLKKVSSKLNTDVSQLKKLLIQNKINYEIFLEEITIEFSWQSLIFQVYNKKIILDENSINEKLQKIVSDKKKDTEYRLAEIELLLENTKDYKNEINEIKNQIKNIGFENSAIKFSASTSAFNGGDIGWINSHALSSDTLNLLKNMKIGDVSEPVIKTNSATFIKLLDKKNAKINNLNIDKIKSNIIAQKKNELLNLYSNNHLSKLKNNTFIKFK